MAFWLGRAATAVKISDMVVFVLLYCARSVPIYFASVKCDSDIVTKIKKSFVRYTDSCLLSRFRNRQLSHKVTQLSISPFISFQHIFLFSIFSPVPSSWQPMASIIIVHYHVHSESNSFIVTCACAMNNQNIEWSISVLFAVSDNEQNGEWSTFNPFDWQDCSVCNASIFVDLEYIHHTSHHTQHYSYVFNVYNVYVSVV